MVQVDEQEQPDGSSGKYWQHTDMLKKLLHGFKRYPLIFRAPRQRLVGNLRRVFLLY